MPCENFNLFILCFQCINEGYFVNLKMAEVIIALVNILIISCIEIILPQEKFTK